MYILFRCHKINPPHFCVLVKQGHSWEGVDGYKADLFLATPTGERTCPTRAALSSKHSFPVLRKWRHEWSECWTWTSLARSSSQGWDIWLLYFHGFSREKISSLVYMNHHCYIAMVIPTLQFLFQQSYIMCLCGAGLWLFLNLPYVSNTTAFGTYLDNVIFP